MKTNYSIETSLPAYLSPKDVQVEKVYETVKNGANNLLAISELLNMPQSTVSGRINDLIEIGRVKYEGILEYKNRKRKQIKLK